MCMKYVNTTTSLFWDVEVPPENGPIAFKYPFNEIVARKATKEKFTIGSFSIVTQINLLGTSKEENEKDNILYSKEELDVVVRLTKCDKQESKRLALDLEKFSVATCDTENRIDGACFPFLNYTRVTKVQQIELEAGLGSYLIKILVKKRGEEESKYTIQSMYHLEVVEKK